MKNILLFISLLLINGVAIGFDNVSNSISNNNKNNLEENSIELMSSSDYYYCIDLKVSGSANVYQTFCDEDPSVASHNCNAEAI
jgi:hypothetical protein